MATDLIHGDAREVTMETCPRGAGVSIARVFPRRTAATPRDTLVFTGSPGLFPPEVETVHVSVSFTWDLPRAEWLAREWSRVAPVEIGGPATGMRGDDFTPGLYLHPGYVITSRGCPNRCWFCEVWKRDGTLRELPITDGWNILDDNLLACTPNHILKVIDMLRRQPKPAEFTGGLEAVRFEAWHAEAFRSLNPKQLFFAYDTDDDWEPLKRAAESCWRAGFTKMSHRIRAYVLIGWPKDTLNAAEVRLRAVLGLGVIPMAMLWRGKSSAVNPVWSRFQRSWARPAAICAPVVQR